VRGKASPHALEWFGKVRSAVSLEVLNSTRVPLSRFVIEVESEEVRNGLPKAPRHSLKFLERWGVPAAFDQAQKIDRDAHEFGEFLLRLIRFVMNLADTESELFL
jgi:hypothetical protein